MDQQNEYCENGYPTASNLKIQVNPWANSVILFTEPEKNNPKIHTQAKRSQITKIPLSQRCTPGGFRYLISGQSSNSLSLVRIQSSWLVSNIHYLVLMLRKVEAGGREFEASLGGVSKNGSQKQHKNKRVGRGCNSQEHNP
jgi:hypothetical protein